ncbi:MAG: peptidylprolyl isomerase [bacterium]
MRHTKRPLYLVLLVIVSVISADAPSSPTTLAPRHPRVTLSTDFGNIIIELYPDKAPKSVANFLKLVEVGFYENLTFHRVVPGFVIQGGDPLGTGEGGPGYDIPAEITRDLTHEEGMVAWAREGDDVNPQWRSSGSQFYITTAAVHRLDGKYTIFGKVVEGMDAVHKIENVPRSLMDRPLDPPCMRTIKAPDNPPLDNAPITQRCGELNLTPYFDEGKKKFKWNVRKSGVDQYTVFSSDLPADYSANEPYKFFPNTQGWMYCEPLRQKTRVEPFITTLSWGEKDGKSYQRPEKLLILDFSGETAGPVVTVNITGWSPQMEDLDRDGIKNIFIWDDRLAPLKDSWLTETPLYPLVICFDNSLRKFVDCTQQNTITGSAYMHKFDPAKFNGPDYVRSSIVTYYAWRVMTGQKDSALKTLGAACDADCQNWLKAHEAQIEQLVRTPRNLQPPPEKQKPVPFW